MSNGWRNTSSRLKRREDRYRSLSKWLRLTLSSNVSFTVMLLSLLATSVWTHLIPWFVPTLR